MAWALLCLVALAPLPFASNRPAAWSIIAFVTGILLALWGWRVANRRMESASLVDHGLRPPALLFGLLVGYVVLQIIPGMPHGIASPYWRLPSQVLGTPDYGSISIAPSVTISSLTRLLTYTAIFWLFLQHFRLEVLAHRAILVLSTSIAAYCAYGVLMAFLEYEIVLWVEKSHHLGSLTSTFFNRNHFATLVGLGLICNLLCLARLLFISRDRPLNAIGILTKSDPTFFFLVATLVMHLVALYLTQSRAGVLSATLAMAAFVSGVVWRINTRRELALTFGILTTGSAVFYFAFAGGAFMKRLEILFDPETSDARWVTYSMILEAIRNHPWLGTGYGTFADAFRIHRGPPVADYFNRAHNVYLESLLGLGVLGAIVLFAIVAWLGFICMRSITHPPRQFIYGWAGACSTLLVALHGAVDFSLQIPAVALYYSAVLGIAVAQSAGRSRRMH